MAERDPRPDRLDGERLDKQRRTLTVACVLLTALLGLLALSEFAKVASSTDPPVVAILVLGILYWMALVGSFLFGRMRQRTIRAGRDGRAVSPRPTWLGPVGAILPGVVIVGAQVLRLSNPGVYDVISLVVSYMLVCFLGLMLGLVVPL